MLAFRRAKQLSSMGWDGFQCFNMWVASTKNFASKEEMGEKFVLSLWDMRKSLPSWNSCGGLY